MRFSIIITSLIAAVSASPVLLPRSCKIGSTTSNGVALRGPFKIKANAPTSKRNGNYAHAGQPNFVPFIVFGVTPAQVSRRASEFYLDGSGRLITIQNGALYYTYEATPTATTGSYLSIGTDSSVNTNGYVYCAIDSSCNLNCGLGALTYNCLGSQAFQPDWLITGQSEASKPACAKFQPIAVPG